MANPLKGEAAFSAGGERYTVAMNVSALILAEDALGKDTPAILDELERGRSLKVLSRVLWAGLQEHHGDVHMVQAEEIMQAATPSVAREALTKAIAAAFPPAAEEKTGNPPMAAAGNGSTGSKGGRQKG